MKSSKAYHLINKIDCRDALEEKASNVIGKCWRLWKLHVAGGKSYNDKVKYFWATNRFRNAFCEFREHKTRWNHFQVDLYMQSF